MKKTQFQTKQVIWTKIKLNLTQKTKRKQVLTLNTRLKKKGLKLKNRNLRNKLKKTQN